MVELLINYLDNKIIGYNTAIQTTKNKILIDENKIDIFKLLDDNHYYINGEIVENYEDPDISDFKEKLTNNDKLYSELKLKIDNEQHIFMDNIISGMSIEEAIQISKNNRDEFKLIEEKKSKLNDEHTQRIKNNVSKLLLQEESSIDYKYYLSMVAIIRDENSYLEEWIRYYIEELGFDHFYLYDNESVIPAKKYLEDTNFKYFDRITFIDWITSNNSQTDSHNHFLENYSLETKWFLAADPDEYVVLKDNSKSLRDFLDENSQYSTIECIWHHFNANGHETRTDEPDMVRFTQEVDWDYGKGNGKKFAQSNRVSNFTNYTPLPRFDNDVANLYTAKEVTDFFQLNHYYTRSYEEFVEKIKRGTCVPYAKRKLSEFFQLNPDMKYLDTGEDLIQDYGSNKNKQNSDNFEDSDNPENSDNTLED